MAAKHLTVLSHPNFPQVFAKAIEAQVNCLFADCSHESPESIPGACDGGFPCGDPATIVIDGQPFCAPHGRRIQLLTSLRKLEGGSRG
jgi:hypothetical protein